MTGAATGTGVRRRHRRGVLVALSALLLIMVASASLAGSGLLADSYRVRAADDRRVPLAVLGDSDSHGYRDSLAFPPGSAARGGRYRQAAAQWTEVLDELAGDRVDCGDFGIWGGRQSVVRALEAIGCERRAPRKQDHQFNLAFSGARCADLLRGPRRQVPRLLTLMAEEPARWRGGVVVIRIGIVDLGGEPQLDRMATDPDDAELAATVASCIADITAARAAIRAAHPQTRVVLVGLFDNAEVPSFQERWRTRLATSNRRAVLDRFDGALRALAAADSLTAFFDDRAWFAARWGGRDDDGVPAYRAVQLAGLRVEHGAGDEPTHTALADGHAGLVVNAVWAQSLSRLLAEELQLPVRPITDAEVETFVRGRYPAAR
ncbi:MAG: SGNH/GDSL hydrolase family protein [Planctomycetes bacterium]|nr:SGNH/GDSL hydrolase family protein [Planctomycetota bacterium]